MARQGLNWDVYHINGSADCVPDANATTHIPVTTVQRAELLRVVRRPYSRPEKNRSAMCRRAARNTTRPNLFALEPVRAALPRPEATLRPWDDPIPPSGTVANDPESGRFRLHVALHNEREITTTTLPGGMMI